MEEFKALKENTVSARGQLNDSEAIRFFNAEGKGKRVLFLGNSMTLHLVKPELGWFLECGMAASAPEKDYVHVLMKKIGEVSEDPAFCICQGSEWELQYKQGEKILEENFSMVRSFESDVIVMRLIENVSAQDFDAETFKAQLGKFLDYLNVTGKAQIILTTGFWRHPGDAAIEQFGKEHGLPVVLLGDLGDRDEMKALGLFEHRGVACHPGDLGMEQMACRIFEEMKKYL